LVEKRSDAGLVCGRPFGRHDAAVRAIDASTGGRCGPDSSGPAFIYESGGCRYACSDAEYFHTSNITGLGSECTGRRATNCRREFVGRQADKRSNRG
jgi:hypothetical protein